MNEVRLKRVESLIRDKISRLIMRGEIKDPRVDTSVTVTRVKAAKDLTSARVWVSSFGGDTATERAVGGLNHAAGFIQSRIGREIHIRNTPKLYFYSDSSIREGIEINQLIDSLSVNKEDNDKKSGI